jgi:predicted permease
VTYSENGLFSGTDSGDDVEVEGFVRQRPQDRGARFDQVGSGYFATLGVPMLLGREFEERDAANSLPVCVINEAFAKRFFAGRNPLGKHVTQVFGEYRRTMEVVGVARDMRGRLRGDVAPRFYMPASQGTFPEPYFEIRTAGDPEGAMNAVRRAVAAFDDNLPILSVRSLGQLLDAQNDQPRMIAQLCTVFGVVALLLAAAGLYGVLSYGVTRRTHEIGIRMALGAARGRVVGMILREAGAMAAIGGMAGIAATLAVTRLIASRLYGVSPADPVTIAAAIGALAGVALAAAYIPAARAARTNPVRALRHE